MLLLVLLLGAVLRLAAFEVFPDFTTQDSPDYLIPADQLAAGGGLAHPRIGSWRAPGYVAFLGPLRWLAGADVRPLMLAQALLGLGAVAGAWVLGRWLGGLGGALALALFCAFHPAYLLFEHTLQAETLGLSLLLAGTAAVIEAAARRSWPIALLGGSLLGAAVLTRANSLPFVVILFLGLVGFSILDERRTGNSRATLRWATAAAVGFLALVAPWLVRQQQMFGRPAVTLNLERCRLIYLAQHRVFDPRLAGHVGHIFRADQDETIFDLVAQLGEEPVPAEDRAAEIFARHLASRPSYFLIKRLRATSVFLGLPNYEPEAPGRHDVLFWFDHFVRQPEELVKLRNDLQLPASVLGPRLEPRPARLVNEVWADAGDFTLKLVRPALLFAALALLAMRFLRCLVRPRPLSPTERIAALLFAGQLATAVVHGWSLADYDRFAVLFDWIPLVVVVTLIRVPHGSAKA